MNVEIERKFLIKTEDFKKKYFKKLYIKQGFLNSSKERTVRVRVSDDKGYITIKGLSNNSGMSRFEWEKEILVNEAHELLLLCEEGMIEKNRYLIKYKEYVFEVDEFLGQNKGLLIAEIELSNENEEFERPDWLGEEVTGRIEYYNSSLSKKPFCNWS